MRRGVGRSTLLAALMLASMAQFACGTEGPDTGGEVGANDDLGAGNIGKDPPPGQAKKDDPPDTRPDGGGPLAPLGSIKVPRAEGGDILDRKAAIALGKAAFWDTRVGSDGQVACATCHFSAGTDKRQLNTVHPGGDGNFDVVSGAGQLFPGITFGDDDSVGSQGVFGKFFQAASKDSAVEQCAPDNTADPFLGNRRVTNRNTPTIVGAAFNRFQFWDGRADESFNGADPFGDTANAGGALGSMIRGGSLASQSVGPPLNPTEMSCAGRTWNGSNSIASKLLDAPILAAQKVHPTDSVLGVFSNWPNNGLKCGSKACTYRDFIVTAFGSEKAKLADKQFSRFWGQAIQAYEETLIPDQTPLDVFLAGDSSALTERQQRGLRIFLSQEPGNLPPPGAPGPQIANCTLCHIGPELTDATVGAGIRNITPDDPKGTRFKLVGNDLGFHAIGVTSPAAFPGLPMPENFDPGRAGLGPNGITFQHNIVDEEHPNPNFPPGLNTVNFNVGAFKTPGLRNVKLTAPYFHNGSVASLEDLVDFYNRGGNFAPFAAIAPIGLDDEQKAALVDFLRNGLTDCRVENVRAPFDHPSIDVPNGPSLAAVGKNGTGSCPFDK